MSDHAQLIIGYIGVSDVSIISIQGGSGAKHDHSPVSSLRLGQDDLHPSQIGVRALNPKAVPGCGRRRA